MNQEIINFLRAALECSVILDPTEPGLSYEELFEVGRRVEYQNGEIGDALQHLEIRFIDKRIQPEDRIVSSWVFFFPEEPEDRNFDALDFVVSELNDRVKADGAAKARLERSLVVERAAAKGISRHDIEVALTEKDGVLRFPHDSGVRQLPSEQHQMQSQGRPALS